jgi:Transposase DNA-binding
VNAYLRRIPGRLFQRFRKLLGQIASAVGQTIPFVCQDWANTKAAYRFFSNERVDEQAILSGHFQATRDRAAKIATFWRKNAWPRT